MKFMSVIEVRVGDEGFMEREDAGDVMDALWGVDMEQAIASELAQHLMVMDDDVAVTVHDVAPTGRTTVPRAKRKVRSR